MRSHRLLSVAVALCLGAPACSSDGGDDGDGAAEDAAPVAAACAPKGDEKPAKALLRCAQTSVAYVSNPLGTGTGVLVELEGERYVLTNLHVVDPFATADVTFGPTTIEDVPVLGVDAGADITLLGPVDAEDRPAIPIGVGDEVEAGDDVYLVGYPGESGGTNATKPDDLEATISRGIVSRTRKVAEFGQTFIQTDASIAGGQSGGPLFDEQGRLIGISGLGFADEFALVLSGADVKEAAGRIVAGDGDEYLALPLQPGDGETSGSMLIEDATSSKMLYLPPADEERTLTFTMRGDGAVFSAMELVSGETLALSGNALEIAQEVENQVAARRGGTPEKLPDATAMGIDTRVAARETSPGTFVMPIPADEGAQLVLERPMGSEPGTVTWESDLPLILATGERVTAPVELDEVVDRVFSPYDGPAELTIDLEAGTPIEIHARSAAGDAGFLLISPKVTLDAVTFADPEVDGIEMVDDTDDGIYGLDARETFTVKETGTYRIRWFANDGITQLIRISIRSCEADGCKGDTSGTSGSSGKGDAGKGDDESDG